MILTHRSDELPLTGDDTEVPMAIPEKEFSVPYQDSQVALITYICWEQLHGDIHDSSDELLCWGFGTV